MAQPNGAHTNGANDTHVSAAALTTAAPVAGGLQASMAPTASTISAMPHTNGTTIASSAASTNGTSIPPAASFPTASSAPSVDTQTGMAPSLGSSPENAPPPPPVNSPATVAPNAVDSITTRLDTLLSGPAPAPVRETPVNCNEAMRTMATAYQRLEFANLKRFGGHRGADIRSCGVCGGDAEGGRGCLGIDESTEKDRVRAVIVSVAYA
ncbi:hypothetical protein LTR78_005695 [Recurvomyces mirabilis]|uniref:Uncharacterized protein n=1 Tax=Recurvomyces mirabilis TaxID=574656 RepID=A0AAE1C1I2_9PEZI|nr:hypothetical protein LTR78_005695 [Recurvomyces mirabilis]